MVAIAGWSTEWPWTVDAGGGAAGRGGDVQAATVCVSTRMELSLGVVELLVVSAGRERVEAVLTAGTWTPRACSARKAFQRVMKSSYQPQEVSSGPGAIIVIHERR